MHYAAEHHFSSTPTSSKSHAVELFLKLQVSCSAVLSDRIGDKSNTKYFCSSHTHGKTVQTPALWASTQRLLDLEGTHELFKFFPRLSVGLVVFFSVVAMVPQHVSPYLLPWIRLTKS